MTDATVDVAAQPSPAHGISFSEATRVWLRVAALSFGGPAGQIAVMHRILVDEKRWIGETRFLHALNFCMLLPGPEAQQLAIYLGWLLHRAWGGVVAGVLFVVPGFLAILALSLIYVAYGDVTLVEGAFFGLKAAVLAIVLQAVVRIGSRALRSRAAVAVAAAAFVAIFFLGVPFPLIVLGAGLIGYFVSRSGSEVFRPGGHGGKGGPGLADADSALGTSLPAHARGHGTLRIAAIFLVLWLAPVALLLLALGPDQVFARLAIFFSQMAVVTFGGAYAVLAYVAQAAAETYMWVTPGEMLDGLGMAETTPGPLIMVVQFVGFLAAFRDPGSLDPYLAAVLASLLVTWVTFTPSFLWIFLGAPYIERLRHNPALGGALAAITAAVVGVVLNLAIWFGLHVLFREVVPVQAMGLRLDVPVLRSVDPAALMLFLGALVAAFRFKVGVLPLLLGAAILGCLWQVDAFDGA
jgi:chromate transporter